MEKTYTLTPESHKTKTWKDTAQYRAIHNSNVALYMVERYLEQIIEGEESRTITTDSITSVLGFVKSQITDNDVAVRSYDLD